MLEKYLERLREASPLVHCITNYVTVNDVANVLLACGASPVMSDEPLDVEDITAVSGALCINIGTLNEKSIRGMFIAGKKARELGHTMVLDPVGAGSSALRTETAHRLTNELGFTAIRGNLSEIKALFTGNGRTRGVDACEADAVTDSNLDTIIEEVMSFAEKTETIIAVTGAVDIVSDGRTAYIIHNGRPEMGKITGTGCQLSALMAAFIAAAEDEALEAAAAAVCTFGLAGEIAWSHMQKGEGNASYRNRIIDAVYNMDVKTLLEGEHFEVVKR